MRFVEGEWLIHGKDRVCMHCGEYCSQHKVYPHGALVDFVFHCEVCKSSWMFITEGPRVHRFQMEYPREDT